VQIERKTKQKDIFLFLTHLQPFKKEGRNSEKTDFILLFA